VGEVLVVHPLGDRFTSCALPDRAGTGRHDVFRPALPAVQCFSAEETLDDVFVVCDDTDPPLSDAFGDVGDALVGAARRSVRTGDASDAGAAVGRSFER
jgi:hypothetical protein